MMRKEGSRDGGVGRDERGGEQEGGRVRRARLARFLASFIVVILRAKVCLNRRCIREGARGREREVGTKDKR
jgi:hypothetical protein